MPFPHSFWNDVLEDLSDDARTFLAGVLEGAGRMQALISDLLSYTRATKYAGGSPPVVSASAILSDVLQGLRSSIEQTRARVSYGELPAVPMHEIHLKQLFQNLISNSLKYKSAENPYVQISAVERDGWIIFSVADNGIGVDPRFGDQIFGLFKRLHTQDEYPGSGIGLAICQRIVEQYGGRIWLERSDPWPRISLLVHRSLPTRPVSCTRCRLRQRPARLIVWLIEDSATDIFVIRDVLRICSFEFDLRVVSDGDAAMSLLHSVENHGGEESPDLILLTSTFPKCTASKFCHRFSNRNIVAACP